MSLTLKLAERVTALDPATFPDEARKWAKDAIADMIGCALLGANTATTDTVILPFYSPGECLVLGRAERLKPLDAALVNGTSSHALDYDDTSKSMSGHPTVIIIPGLLALAETRGLSGHALLDAYIIGVETATRFARGVNFRHYELGWHPTATLGIFGAAAAASRIIGLNTEQTASALGMAASLASGIKANFGTETKPLHAGLAARNALFAALMAEQGITAAPTALEHPQGFLDVFNGKGQHDAEKMLANWAEPLDLLAPGISIKKYPCVYSVHGAIDAAIDLAGREIPDPAQITDVLVKMHRRRMLPHVMNPATSALNAKFSLSYAVARGFVTRAVTLDHFEDAALHDPEVMRVMGLIRMEPHQDDSNDYGAEVVVTLADGRVLSHAVSAPSGRGPEAPLPDGLLRTKFLDCASRSITAEAGNRVFDLLMQLETLGPITELTGAIAAGTRAKA